MSERVFHGSLPFGSLTSIGLGFTIELVLDLWKGSWFAFRESDQEDWTSLNRSDSTFACFRGNDASAVIFMNGLHTQYQTREVDTDQDEKEQVRWPMAFSNGHHRMSLVRKYNLLGSNPSSTCMYAFILYWESSKSPVRSGDPSYAESEKLTPNCQNERPWRLFVHTTKLNYRSIFPTMYWKILSQSRSSISFHAHGVSPIKLPTHSH